MWSVQLIILSVWTLLSAPGHGRLWIGCPWIRCPLLALSLTAWMKRIMRLQTCLPTLFFQGKSGRDNSWSHQHVRHSKKFTCLVEEYIICFMSTPSIKVVLAVFSRCYVFDIWDQRPGILYDEIIWWTHTGNVIRGDVPLALQLTGLQSLGQLVQHLFFKGMMRSCLWLDNPFVKENVFLQTTCTSFFNWALALNVRILH